MKPVLPRKEEGSGPVASGRWGILLTLVFSPYLGLSCSGSTPWSATPSPVYDDTVEGPFLPPVPVQPQIPKHYNIRSIGKAGPEDPIKRPEVVETRIALSHVQGRVLGKFRNTYYDFPSEKDFTGPETPLFDQSCQQIARVKQSFHDQLCMQGSGLLSSGRPVSFARRNCSCARVCPRSKQQICFEALSRRKYPWGRGATGRAITPLLTVAVDSKVIPLKTPVYIPEYEGVPRDPSRRAIHDGCFIAQDRGLKVKGKHVDVFTGEPVITRMWNKLVPSNQGVTVVLDSPKCARAN